MHRHFCDLFIHLLLSLLLRVIKHVLLKCVLDAFKNVMCVDLITGGKEQEESESPDCY